MSGSRKKRKEKARHQTRRATRYAERLERAADAFESVCPGGVAAFHSMMKAGIDRVGIHDVKEVGKFAQCLSLIGSGMPREQAHSQVYGEAQ